MTPILPATLYAYSKFLIHISRGQTETYPFYEGHLESKERFAIQRYLLIIGKKKNMQVL
jgi:hypothetical protein